ncbi:MAG: carbamoyltransferase [Gemmatimonadetes bacterium]|nr:carbamoyltransferase [Gemmatimonadota bacterium]
MHILGISCFYHDAAAALLQDGSIVAAAQEERFTRRKNDYSYPSNAIAFCLGRAGITSRDLDFVVFYEKPLLKFERILLTTLRTFPRSSRTFSEAMILWFQDKLWIKDLLRRELGVPAERILFSEHHVAHAASAFFCSPFEEAAILTVDGVGEWTTTTMGRGSASWNGDGHNRIEIQRELHFPHSLGLLYSAFTAWLGFKVNEGEYKVMGMAPYGEPRYQDLVYKLIHVEEDGSFWLDMDYFSYHYSPENTFNGRFVDIFGPPREPDSEFFTDLTHPGADRGRAELERNQRYADVAASIQRVTEDVMLKMARELHRNTGLKNLCMAGGVALNSVANGRILLETPFEELFIQPAAGDAGGAVGAALWVWHVLLGKPRTYVMEDAYLGAEYSEADVRSFLEANSIPYESCDDGDRLLDRIVDDLTVGKVVGWFQGRFEWGPRALGNRSILADPRRAEMKEIVNEKIKFREPFRPFAPVVPESRAAEFFEGLPEPERHYPARYMLLVLPWTEEAAQKVPAVDHEGTGRLQTVRREWNPRYYDLVERFGEATGVPVLLNTSFNLRGEPIVSSPADAWKTFSKSGLDVLVMGNHLVRK